ncbi:unnamed protein product [Moneuplotes crassus]|uniref:Conserved oligomeric Golgi complex subunit 3 N-terminal domain-containing protein n=2 Tax=Euplotes crassus TaxID=5936 RepID=A0AAD2DBZ7_EUPCR|nr:unnamed protein product [Moneuplotes crassus]
MKDWNESTALTREERKALSAFIKELSNVCGSFTDFGLQKQPQAEESKSQHSQDAKVEPKEESKQTTIDEEVQQQNDRKAQKIKALDQSGQIINTWKDTSKINKSIQVHMKKVDTSEKNLFETTKGFRDTCVFYVKKNNNLTKLINGFEANLAYYMSYDELTKESNQVMENLEEDPKAFLSFVSKINHSLKYFKRNFDYKGSETYRERYQTLYNNTINFIVKHILECLRETHDKILVNFLKVLEYVKSNEEAPDNSMVKTIADIDLDLLYYTQSSCRYFKVKEVIVYLEEEKGAEIDRIYEYYLSKRQALLTYLLDDLYVYYDESYSLSQTFSSLLTYLKTLLSQESTFFYAHFAMVPKKYHEFQFFIEESVLQFLQQMIQREQSFEEIALSSDISADLMERSLNNRSKRKVIGRAHSDAHRTNITQTFIVKLQKSIDEKLSTLAHYKFLDFFDHAENIGEEVVKFTDQIMKSYEANKTIASQDGDESPINDKIEMMVKKRSALSVNNIVLWGSFRLEMINKGMELVEKLEKRVSDSVYKNVINELVAIIIRSIQCFNSPDAKIEHYFFIYQNLLILKNHFKDSLEEEQAEQARRARLEETKQTTNRAKFFDFDEKDNTTPGLEQETSVNPLEVGDMDGGLVHYLWETFRYWFVYDYQEVKENSLKIIEDELKKIAWNIKEIISRDMNLKDDSKESMEFLDKLRIYVESIDTPNTGEDLNYLFQLVLSYK